MLTAHSRKIRLARENTRAQGHSLLSHLTAFSFAERSTIPSNFSVALYVVIVPVFYGGPLVYFLNCQKKFRFPATHAKRHYLRHYGALFLEKSSGWCAHRTAGATTAQCSALTEPPVRLSNRPVRSPNHRCDHRTMQCAHRTTGAVIEQACALTEPPVRPPHNAVRSPNHRCGYRTGLCAHRTTGAVIEQSCALTEPPVRPPHNAVRSPNHRCGFRCAHRTAGATTAQCSALTEPLVRPPHNAVRTGGSASALHCAVVVPMVR